MDPDIKNMLICGYIFAADVMWMNEYHRAWLTEYITYFLFGVLLSGVNDPP